MNQKNIIGWADIKSHKRQEKEVKTIVCLYGLFVVFCGIAVYFGW